MQPGRSGPCLLLILSLALPTFNTAFHLSTPILTASDALTRTSNPICAFPGKCSAVAPTSFHSGNLALPSHSFSRSSCHQRGRTSLKSSVSQDQACSALKGELLKQVSELKRLQDRDGKEAIDFGVKGGELDSKTRAPRNLAADGGFYKISEDVGKAADAVFETVNKLEALNPTTDISLNFKTSEGKSNPIHGRWQLLFSTAADASFSKNSTRGDARVSNEVDAVTGKVMNIIEFLPPEDGSTKTVDELKVRLKAEALSEKRIGLTFKYVKARLRKLFGLPVKLPLWFPVPGPFFTRILYLFRKQKQIPKAYFDILYLDSELRIHKTGEGNIFIQARPEWQAAWKE